MRYLRLVTLGSLLIFGYSGSAATVEHVIQISVDGLRGDFLGGYVTNVQDAFFHFRRLHTEGSYTYNARCDYDISETVPNHISMITGRPVLQPEGQSNTVHHGFASNFPTSAETIHGSGNPNLDYIPSVFDVIHDHGLGTALYAGKSRLEILASSYNETWGAVDTVEDDNGKNKVDYSLVSSFSEGFLASYVAGDLTNAPYHYTFIHFVNPDQAGHGGIWGSLIWSNAVTHVDNFLGTIFQAIDSTPSLRTNVAIILTADHGGEGGSHTDPTIQGNYTIPFYVWGPGIPANRDLYSLWSNRFDPGAGRPDYNDQEQPIRNGDAPNLALMFLGLPMIQGSSMTVEMSAEPVALSWSMTNGQLILSWPLSASGFQLEGSPSLTNPQWETIWEGVQTNAALEVYSITMPTTGPAKYFRLSQ